MRSRTTARWVHPAGSRERDTDTQFLFRSVFTKSLRDYRWAIVGWGMGMGLVVFAQFASFKSTVGGAPPAEIRQLVQQFQFFGEAARVDTPGGFVTFKIMGLFPLLLGIWSVLAGSRMTRGEEERGALDILLSTPARRENVLLQKILALAAAGGAIALVSGSWILVGMASAGVDVKPGRALLASANGTIAALLFGVIALFAAQFMGRRAAAGWAAGLMAVAFVLEGAGRATPNLSWARVYSPLYYYDRNLPLVPGQRIDGGALVILVLSCVLPALAVLPLFAGRDLGRSALADWSSPRRHAGPARPALHRADRSIWFRSVGMLALRRQGPTILAWIASLTIFAGYLVVVAHDSEKQLESLLSSSSVVRQLFRGANLGTNAGFISALVFTYTPLLMTIFAGMLAGRWAADLDAGGLELVLSTPQTRLRVILERYTAVVAATVTGALVIPLSIALVGWKVGFTTDAGHVFAASLGTVPLALITSALVFALAGRLPPGAVMGAMAAFLGASFMAEILQNLFNLPGWIADLSIFSQYGSPMLTGLNWMASGVMVVIAAVLLVPACWYFVHGDLDRGTAGS